MPVPTPKPFRGTVDRLDERCGISDCISCTRGLACAQRCERWEVTSCDITIPSVALQEPGLNYDNAAPLAAAGGRPMCGSSPFFSRVSISIPFIRTDPQFGNPTGAAVPMIHFEVRIGKEGIVSRVARFTWQPNDFDDFGYLFQVSGFLATRVELFGWCELSPSIGDAPAFPIPLRTRIGMLIDRQGGAPDIFINAMANCAIDTS